jgi:CIC family chloride channel protein
MRQVFNKNIDQLRQLFTIGFGPHTIIIILAIGIGAMTGGVNILFRYILVLVKETILIGGQNFLHIGDDISSRFLLPLIPMSGAIILIIFAKIFPGEIYGYKFPDFLEKVNLSKGFITLKSILLKMITPAITIGSGGSAGVEGPIAYIGGGIGSLTAQLLGSSVKQRTLLIAAGAAGAISATFNAPIAGVMFATEIILLGNYELMSFGAVVISAGIATAISRAYYGTNPTFTMPISDIKSIFETPLYIILGLCMGVLSVIYIKIFYWFKGYFEKANINEHVKPIIGAFMIGVIGIFFPHVMSDGYEYIVEALNGNYLFFLLIILAFVKIFATSITIGSGCSGGVFAPSLFIGAMAGGAFGVAVNYILPNFITTPYISQPGTYAAIGMGAFLASVTHAPLTGMFLLFELTGNYRVIIPVMLSSVTGVFMATRIFKDSIDTAELSNRGINLHEGWEVSILGSLKVSDVMTKTFVTIHKNDTLNKVLDLVIMGKGLYFPVVDSHMEMIGIISMNDIKSVVLNDYIKQIVTAGDLCTEDVVVLTSIDNLNEALEKLSLMDLDEMPVVDFHEHKKVIGMIRRSDIISTYNKEIMRRHSQESTF